MILSGTIRNTVNLAAMDSRWQQKKQNVNNGNKEEMTAEEREHEFLQQQADEIRENRKPAQIDVKLESGGELTQEEVEYLKRNNPEKLKEYEEVRQQRKNYKRQLESCDSKEEVEKLKTTKMGEFLAEAKTIASDPHIPKAKKYSLMKKLLAETSAIEDVHEEFLQSARYATLPDEEDEEKEKKKTREKDGDFLVENTDKVLFSSLENTDIAEKIKELMRGGSSSDKSAETAVVSSADALPSESSAASDGAGVGGSVDLYI